MSPKRNRIQDRYEIGPKLGQGGMGIVYQAHDVVVNCDVALKTLLDVDNPELLALFYRECGVLAGLVHPNLISIQDIGEIEKDGKKMPCFVMPLLRGTTLDNLIKKGSPRLSVEGVVSIIEQACRGLQAAHENKPPLVHRDIKPSNIFVLDNNSVKIIDFGIAKQASLHSKSVLKGTLFYLAPEQFSGSPPSPMSDLFALGVTTYQALTRRRPFDGANDAEVSDAIRRHSPPAATEINADVPFAVSQVIHKALAKNPFQRFYDVKEFGEALQKAARNETIEYFDVSRINPRLELAAQSFEKGDYQVASSILAALEEEAQLDPRIVQLRRQLDQALTQSEIQDLIKIARSFHAAGEYADALRTIQDVLQRDKGNAPALALKLLVERERREKETSKWIALARKHLENNAFSKAREALENVFKERKNDPEALRLSAEIGRREQELDRDRERKSQLYQAARLDWEKGEVSSALSKLEVLVAMDPDIPEMDSRRSSTYQSFYNQVHSEHNALTNSYEEARRALENEHFEAALEICRQYLSKYPNHALFQALRFDVDTRRRQKLSGTIAETDRRLEDEPDLERRGGILEEVLRQYPAEPHFLEALEALRQKQGLVNSIVEKARKFEKDGQLPDALGQWEILRSIHKGQPGLAFEIERVIKLRDDKTHKDSRARWVQQTDRCLENGEYDKAGDTIGRALAEFPADPELLELEKLVRQSQMRGSQAMEAFGLAREDLDNGLVEEGLLKLREANGLDPRNVVIRTVLINTLLDRASQLMFFNSTAATEAVREVLKIEPANARAVSLISQIEDRAREDFITWCLTQARKLQADGDLMGALAIARQGLASFPQEPRLLQLLVTLKGSPQPPPLPPSPVPPVNISLNPPFTEPAFPAGPKKSVAPWPPPKPPRGRRGN
jgi:eukaryotic-like serine/threonine-protein kinase